MGSVAKSFGHDSQISDWIKVGEYDDYLNYV
jgi:hypothetical protein